MNDFKLELRKENYHKCTFDLVDVREKNNLSLRKQKLEEMILSKRLKIKQVSDQFSLEIDPLKLNIQDEYKSLQIEKWGNEISMIISMLKSTEIDYVKFAVYLLRVYFAASETSKLVTPIIENGVIEILLDILKSAQDESLIFEIYWVLLNLPMVNYDNPSFLEQLTASECLEIYVKHLSSEYSDIVDNILWLVNNLCCDSTKCRDEIMNSKIYDYIIDVVSKSSNPLSLLRYAIWFVSVIMKSKETIPDANKILKSLVICSNYLYTNDYEIMSHCLWGIYYISEFDEHLKTMNINKKILKSGAVAKIFKMNFSQNVLCLSPSLRILGNLLGGDHKTVDELLDFRVIDFFDAVLTVNKSTQIKREIMWALSNIAAGSLEHVFAVVHAPIIEKVVEFLSDNNFAVKKEACFVVKNCVSNNCFNASTELVNKGALKGVIDILANDKNNSLLLLALQSVGFILESGECVMEIQGINPFKAEIEEMGGKGIFEMLVSIEGVNAVAVGILKKFYE